MTQSRISQSPTRTLSSALDPVRYLTTRDLPPPRPTGYDYVLAGNGLFKRAHNRHVEACILLASLPVAGLPPLEPYVRILFPRIPERMLLAALADARSVAMARPTEAMYHVYHTPNGQAGSNSSAAGTPAGPGNDAGHCRLRLARPPQAATAGTVRYRGGDHPDIVMDLHSHCEADAFFSHTDDGDELGFRFYAVMANIFSGPTLSLRLGIYGDRVPVDLALVFDGTGPFRAPGGFMVRRTKAPNTHPASRQAEYPRPASRFTTHVSRFNQENPYGHP